MQNPIDKDAVLSDTSISLLDRAVTRQFYDRHAAATEEAERIIQATFRVVERTGTLDPRVRDILTEAGLSTPAFYRHFASKDELLVVILDYGTRRLARNLEHRMEQAEPGLERIHEWIHAILAQAGDTVAASRTRPFVAHNARLADQFPMELERSTELVLAPLVAAIEEARERGLVRSSDVRRDARSVMDLTSMFVERHVFMDVRPTEDDVAHLLAFCDRALGVLENSGATD
jgi:AcrR family transcriptional regulator